jgi:hypothetical protein
MAKDTEIITNILEILEITAERCQFVPLTGVQRRFNSLRMILCVCLCDGDGSTFEDVYVCQQAEVVSKITISAEMVAKITISSHDDSIAIMLLGGVIKLAHRRARDMAWTVEVVADGTWETCFSAPAVYCSRQCV